MVKTAKIKTYKIIRQDKGFHFLNMITSTIVLILVFYPLYYILISSLSSGAAVSSGKVFLYPVDITFDGYEKIIENNSLVTGFMNTIFYTLCGTAINVFMTVLAAYPLSRKDMHGRNWITFFFAFTMWFNGGLIPTYILFKDLNLIDNRLVMIIPGAISIWNMIITRTYFQKSIPEDLMEASRIDGASHFTYLFKIAIPLAKPILAVITLYYAVGHWNQYFNAMLYLNTPDLFSLQLVLRGILITGSISAASEGSFSAEDMIYLENLQQILKYSVIVVSTIPMLILYPFIQKYFVKGIMVGAIKG